MKIRRLISSSLVKRTRRLMADPVERYIRSALPGFDEIYYQFWYRDVVGFRGGSVRHYLVHGWREGRDPSAGFSTAGYLKANPDVERANLNPLVHFLDHGFGEGRTGWQKDPSAPAPQPRDPGSSMKLLPAPAGH